MQQPVLVDLYAAQAATGIRPGTIRLWVHRGEITRHGYDKRGRVLVELNELQNTIQEKAKKAQQVAA